VQAEILEILTERRELRIILRGVARDADAVVRRGLDGPGALPVVGPGEPELRPGAIEHVGNALLRGGVIRPGDARLARLKRARLDGVVDRLKRGLVRGLVDALLLKELAEDLIAGVGGEFVVDRRLFALLRLGLRILRGALAGEREAADPRSEADKAREAHGRAPLVRARAAALL